MTYTYDKATAEKVVRFIEKFCTHVKGKLMGKPYIPEKWEREEIIKPLFGWKRPDGTRRYRRIYIELPKKNSKTTLAAAICMHLLHNDGELGAEIYSAACDKEQANICFEIASGMVKNNKDLLSRTKVLRNSLYVDKTNNFYKSVSHEAFTKHGFNAHAIIVDEYAFHPDNELVEALESGMAAREQPLTIYITTAGIRKEGMPGWNMHQYALKVKNKIIKDDALLVVMYGADDKDDITSEAVWKKANPNYGKSVNPEYLKERCKNLQPNTFKRFHLNIWTASEMNFISPQDWDKCNLGPIKMEGNCIATVDLSASVDFTCLGFLFDRVTHLDFKLFTFIPEDTFENRVNREVLRPWVDAGYIVLTPGNVVDYDFIIKKILDHKEQIQEVAFDPWNKAIIVNGLSDKGVEMIEYPQDIKKMSPAVKELRKLLMKQKINHEGNPVLSWMNSNIALVQDANDNEKFIKGKSTDKIDGMICMAMGVGRVIHEGFQKPTKSIYETGYFNK